MHAFLQKHVHFLLLQKLQSWVHFVVQSSLDLILSGYNIVLDDSQSTLNVFHHVEQNVQPVFPTAPFRHKLSGSLMTSFFPATAENRKTLSVREGTKKNMVELAFHSGAYMRTKGIPSQWPSETKVALPRWGLAQCQEGWQGERISWSHQADF